MGVAELRIKWVWLSCKSSGCGGVRNQVGVAGIKWASLKVGVAGSGRGWKWVWLGMSQTNV